MQCRKIPYYAPYRAQAPAKASSRLEARRFRTVRPLLPVRQYRHDATTASGLNIRGGYAGCDGTPGVRAVGTVKKPGKL
jgi:hypothetical protein